MLNEMAHIVVLKVGELAEEIDSDLSPESEASSHIHDSEFVVEIWVKSDLWLQLWFCWETIIVCCQGVGSLY